MYMDNLQSQAQRQAEIDFPNNPDDQKKAVADKLAEASQMLMDGMQVHYRGAGGNDPDYGHNTTFSTFLLRNNQLVTDANGDPLKLEVASNLSAKARRTQIAAWVRANGGGTAFTCETDAPEGFDDNTSRPVYGNRHESDCEGMASFRLRTLPPGFKPVGVVSGRLRAGGIGHVVAVYESSDGRVFLSSNGKQPIEVTASGTAVSSNDIHTAVVAEFSAIYHGHAEADFFFGIAKPSTFTGTPVQVANSTADQLMKDANNDDILHSSATTRNIVPPVDFNKLKP
jgi:hypothetical protein